ncbi:MAG: NAD(P)/FAD-dependent oxidoreductase [Pseudomonadota bacterium]
MADSHFDVLIIGAGISGIGQGCHLRRTSPDLSFAILEARGDIGGTWDLFRYPGIRSDSDMYTFGYRFRPWASAADIAPGPEIMTYLRETAEEYQLAPHIRFRSRVTAVNWNPSAQVWEADVTPEEGAPYRLTAGFIVSCTGYYNYEKGYLPDWPGYEDYAGQIAHPQHWPEDLDYAGKRVLIIGSGATAVTLAPSMAKTAGHVTLLQRSPTWIFSRPAIDPLTTWVNRLLPGWLGRKVNRVKNILLGIYIYSLSRKKPHKLAAFLRKEAAKGLGGEALLNPHFSPDYDPWDQRLCLIPDGDLYEALKDGSAEIVTDHVERFTPSGVVLKSGAEIEADVVVPATGLEIQLFGGIRPTLDGAPVVPEDHTLYRGMMLSNVPNFAVVFGYTNASWTLKADLTGDYVCRLLNRMKAKGQAVVTPVLAEGSLERKPLMGLQSGYLLRAEAGLPKQGAEAPWKNHENYVGDMLAIRYGRFDDGVLAFE